MARRTKADAQATHSSLLDAAEQLFQARGVSRTSLNDIALAAGTTRGAIYWHFKDKADLFNAMMERVTLPLEAPMARAGLAHGTNTLTQLRAALLDALHLIANDDQTRRVLQIATHKMEFTDELGDVQTRRLRTHNDCVAYNRAALERAFNEQQKAPPIALDTAALGLQIMVEGLVQHWLLNPQAFDLVHSGQAMLDTYLAGLGLHATHTPALENIKPKVPPAPAL